MRILITGSREWRWPDDVMRVLQTLKAKHGPFTLVHGGCPTGVDYIASRWLIMNPDCTEEVHPADWRKGKAAGPARNRHMVALGADRCLAFINVCTSDNCPRVDMHPSHGTMNCATLAETKEIPTARFYAPALQTVGWGR